MRYHLSELKQLLARLGGSALKKWSQNFLIDGNILKKILLFSQIHKEDHVLEIGPGPGALTEFLLQNAQEVFAVEIDPLWAKALEELHIPEGHKLHIFLQDALTLDLETLPLKRKIQVVANLPYHITTPLLAKLLPLHKKIHSLTVMVQKEFKERMCAKPGTKQWNSFALFLQFYGDIEPGFTVPASCFFPPPKVDSSVIRIVLKAPPLSHSTELFFSLVRTAFNQRRKMLRVSLKKMIPLEEIDRILDHMGCPISIRPEQLSLAQFIQFFMLMKKEVKD